MIQSTVICTSVVLILSRIFLQEGPSSRTSENQRWSSTSVVEWHFLNHGSSLGLVLSALLRIRMYKKTYFENYCDGSRSDRITIVDIEIGFLFIRFFHVRSGKGHASREIWERRFLVFKPVDGQNYLMNYDFEYQARASYSTSYVIWCQLYEYIVIFSLSLAE